MKIKKYTINELREELHNESLWNKNLIPVTKQRVLSYIHNPNADGDEHALFVAYSNKDKDRIVGYIGVLPDRIRLDNVEHKIAWATSWWVDPSHRNIGTGGFLLLTVLNHYNLATSGATDSAEKVYEACKKLSTSRSVAGMEIIVRCCSHHLLLKKYPALKIIGPLLKIVDGIVNMFIDLRLFLWKRTHLPNKAHSIEFISEIDDETEDFIREKRRNSLSTRGAKELNWILKYPWILSAPVADKTASKYFFSSVSNRFFYLNMKVYDVNGHMTGFIMFKVRNNILSIPYLYFDESALTSILYLIGFIILDLKIDILHTYNSDIINNFSRINFPCIYRNKRVKRYHLSNKFKDTDFNKCFIQDGDGDCVFT